jgi:hypothetical protein
MVYYSSIKFSKVGGKKSNGSLENQNYLIAKKTIHTKN